MDGKHDDFDIAVERAILRVASRPPMPGILMSISTTSTAFARHHLTASSPHDASPTTFIPFISSRMRRIPARTSSWSSTSRTLIKGISPEIGITLLIVSHSYISGFYCNFETLKMVGIRFSLVFVNSIVHSYGHARHQRLTGSFHSKPCDEM